MATFHRDTLVPLAKNRVWPSISVYMPTHRAGTEKAGDRIRFKNLTNYVCEQLRNGDMRHPDSEHYCAPLRDLLDSDEFWRAGADGLAVFVSPDRVETFRIDGFVPEVGVVGDRFYLRPLIAAAERDHRFLALTLSNSGCHLYRGDATGIEEIELKGAPKSMEDELKYDVAGPGLTQVSVGQATSGNAIFHGKGGVKDAKLPNLDRYMKDVHQAVADALENEGELPLVLFGVDYETSYYRMVNTYPNLIDEQVMGATDELKPYMIQAKAIDTLQPFFQRKAQMSVDELWDFEGSELAAHDPKWIAQAAAEGRVKALFFDDEVQPVDESGWDLIDIAAVETVLHGGDIHAFVGENAPLHGVAAILRW